MVSKENKKTIIEMRKAETVCQKMCELPSWANGLVLNADGYRTPFYCKD